MLIRLLIAVVVVGIVIHFVTNGESTRQGMSFFSDETTRAFVAGCQSRTRGDADACRCAATQVKDSMGPERWRAVGYALSGQKGKLDQEIAKLGFSGSIMLAAQYSEAIDRSERLCRIPGLGRAMGNI